MFLVLYFVFDSVIVKVIVDNLEDQLSDVSSIRNYSLLHVPGEDVRQGQDQVQPAHEQ